MGKRIFEISMSVDGFITATDQSADNPMGHDESGSSGHVLHQWVHNYEHETAEATVPDTRRPDVFGAIICGRRTYETSLPWWQADGPSGPLRLPVVVLASGQPTKPPADSVYSFATNVEDAIAQASKLAGGKDISVMGGGTIGGAFLRAGLLDEIKIHVAPVIFGQGTRLFDEVGSRHIHLEQIEAAPRPDATHLRYRVLPGPSKS